MKADLLAFAHLNSGGLLIVETRETVRAIRQTYDRAQRKAGKAAWPSVRVSTLDDWLALLWKELRAQTRDQRILRSDAQTLRIVERIVERDSAFPLLNRPSTVRAVLRSWRRLHEWQLELSPLMTATLEDQSFRRWTEELAAEQWSGGWIDRARLSAVLTADPPRSLAGERVAVLGFDPEPPAVRQLFAAARASGAEVDRLVPELVPARCYQFRAANVDDELTAAARWARQLIEADPDAQVAVIVPDLAARRHVVRAAFDRVLDPSRLLPTRPQELSIYSMIGGTPLAEHAVVDSALRLLACAAGTVAWTDAGQLLRSPYIRGWDGENGTRARLDRRLRRDGRTVWRIADLLSVARGFGAEHWAEAVGAIQRELAPPPLRASPGAWAQRVSRALRAAGWADGRSLASSEFQAADRLRELIAEFATWDSMMPPLEFESARHELERLIRATGFQPESGDPRIRVLDTLDHPGPGCDGLWIVGFSADRWPQPADPDPFLPLAAQRAAGMPWASAESQLSSVQRAVARLAGAAATVVWSWPGQVDDAQLEPSALRPEGLADWPRGNERETATEAIFHASRIEVLDDLGPALPPGTTRLRGGTRVLELQAKCPFRALGELRLGATELESPRPGVGRAVRGQLAHRALEILWRGLRSQAALCELTPQARHLATATAVRKAGAEWGGSVPAALLGIELNWLERAIEAILAEELLRAPFVVRDLELTERQLIAGIALEFRIDRIDELDACAGGGEFIIDYKTGRPQTPRWFGGERDMPQLPAYAISRSQEVAGLAFGQINLREPGFRGVVARDEARSAVRESRAARARTTDAAGFAEVLADWRAWTTMLMTAHVAGEARVHPLSRATCRECALAALCRIGSDWPQDEASGEADSESDDDD